MSKKISVEDKIYVVNLYWDKKRKPISNCVYVWCQYSIYPTMDLKLWIYGNKCIHIEWE
jgi:hypothetical protein